MGVLTAHGQLQQDGISLHFLGLTPWCCGAGHRVLLFSTMTKLLDLLESYLAWRKVGPQADASMGYLRIDGSTSLEDRFAILLACPCAWH